MRLVPAKKERLEKLREALAPLENSARQLSAKSTKTTFTGAAKRRYWKWL